ncbi:phospholipase C, phosphocholine-specific [Streptomyces sp. NBC_01267]|uniref:phosphocholine-specific phospholipase C n=1 Tax=unclassified Streptomyces TaxID=2593676 RepID=UPI002023EA8B|nr:MULTISPECIES: phospholipase C, phosphocholine-specific [unclassified Streptomyces]MCX4553352.1 phospholipase C, phosphocholine-specific [Streptomyces sp. NBC_01500]WSC18315.1 phospholipase C, phosphocholine-specific [Streptomyces sp. NBC_01766]WSV52357.1 phospholipase C, phosphocholine-specific [Streptomyces sp. NBC_01014]
MATFDRRRFLQAGGATAASAAALSMFPPAIGKAMALPALSRSRSLKDVQHVVILMQENRSFDHYFGGLRGVRGFGDPRPALLPDGKPVWHQPAAATHTGRYNSRGLPDSATEVLPWYIDPKNTSEYLAGTDHGWSSGHLAWNQGRHDQWVNQKQDALTMGYLKRQDLLYHYALAEAFTICDSYFCSVHADTAPNRIHLWTGTSDPRNVYGRRPNGPGLSERNNTNGYTWTTYPERLEAAKVSWKLYQGGTGEPGSPTDNYTDNSLMFFEKYQVAEGASGPLVEKGASDHTLKEFRADVEHGTLPQVSWIVPPYKYSEHPSASPTDGATYINLVLEALTSNPEVWGRTVFIVNYDENDGLFDHVVPPMPPVTSGPDAQGMVSRDLVRSLGDEILDLGKYPGEMSPLVPGADPGGLQPIGLGPRVPLLVVSPWSRGGWVCSETFDHTSVLQFLEARFGIHEPNISAWRRSVCGDLTSALDFSGANPAPVSIQVPAPITSEGKPYQVPLPQSMPSQEPGVRRARALPYDVLVNEGDEHKGRFQLDLANRGRAGAAFYVYDRKHPQSAPRRYTVSARDTLSDYWQTAATGGAYQLAAYGPNGTLCEFAGSAADGLRARFSHDGGDRIRIRITNHGRTTRTVLVADAYGTKGSGKTHRLHAGASTEVTVSVRAHSGWYDITVTESGAGESGTPYRRRWSGHLENGRPSTSDPGPHGS